MREPPYNGNYYDLPLRITPAHAGTTFSYIATNASIQDHPRSCGNHHLGYALWKGIEGSPPLMREPLSYLWYPRL